MRNYKFTESRLVRMRILDRCFSSGVAYDIDALKKECNKELSLIGLTPISRRTIYNDIDALESNWKVEFERAEQCKGKVRYLRFYKYADPNFSIWKDDTSAAQVSELRSVMLMLQQFKDIPQFDKLSDVIEGLQRQYCFAEADTSKAISFEINPYGKGMVHLNPLFTAILSKRTVKLTHCKFGCKPKEHTVHPYLIKQYNGRWYLFCLSHKKRKMYNFALDRIEKVEPSSVPYIECPVDLKEYFEDIIGVSVIDAIETERILLKFSKEMYPYAITKPLHGSQTVIDEKERIISIDVKPTNDFYETLLMYGSNVEVLSPQGVRDHVKDIIIEMLYKYK